MIPTSITPSVSRDRRSSSEVGREFKAILKHANPRIAGSAESMAALLRRNKLRPRHRIKLFDSTFYFSDVLQIPELRFFIAYIAQPNQRNQTQIYPRVIYKDLSLIWRTASHFTQINGEIWIGKGDTQTIIEDGEELIVSDEATTDLPLEMQTAIESLLKFKTKAANGSGVLNLVLKHSHQDRIEAYHDFVQPRRKAAADPDNLIHQGKSIARFTRKNDPTSLSVAGGFEPDFQNGILEHRFSKSKLYGGRLHRVRVLSTNQQIQYYFFAGKRHVWIATPQPLTTELSSYGVRTIDVIADEDLFIPGYEYHHYEETENGPELYSQIPPGFAGEICQVDDAKADASPWLDQIPMIRQFRKEVLGE